MHESKGKSRSSRTRGCGDTSRPAVCLIKQRRPSLCRPALVFFPEEPELGKGTLVIQDLCWNVGSFVPEERRKEEVTGGMHGTGAVWNQKGIRAGVFSASPYSLPTPCSTT